MTNSTSASIDVPKREILLTFWRPAGLTYLLACCGGLVLGFWPRYAYLPKDIGSVSAPLPVLQALSAAQTLWILLVLPIIIFRRVSVGQRRWSLFSPLEVVGWVMVTIPFYIAAVYLSDARLADAVRSAIYFLCLVPLAWSAGGWLSRRAIRGPVLLFCTFIAIGIPAVYYLLREFAGLSSADATWLWDISPATFAWSNAQSRISSIVPSPAWAMLTWLIVGILTVMLYKLLDNPPDFIGDD